MLTADCVPVLLADPQAGVVGVAHAGRVGAAAGVLEATLTAMAGLGAQRRPTSRCCWGPAICGGLLRGARGDARRGRRGAARQRLPGPAAARPGSTCAPGCGAGSPTLGVAGVGVDPRCTAEDPDLYSYRRDRRTGRLAAVTWLDPTR